MSKSLKRKIQTITCILSAAFIIYGINRGEMEVVLNKAVNICLECIGLG
ncbi:CD1871A family CXXC motif-containing protein [Anaerosacchariphilus polymeriproducens]|nr:CD1871A family CXXC motif-containing protein [Anaerosacchariphilus polymeriproducens]